MDIIPTDKRMLNSSLQIMQKMYNELRTVSVSDAMKHISEFDEATQAKFARKDGKDTRYFDIKAEEALSVGTPNCQGHISSMIGTYDISGVVITEERGKVPSDIGIKHNTPLIISDPVDRSSYVESLPKKHRNAKTMGELFDAENTFLGKDKARIDGCNSSITLIRDNDIKYSMVLNLINKEIFVAFADGIFSDFIENVTNIDSLVQNGSKIKFRKKESLEMVSYTQPGKYKENFNGTHLRFFNLDETIQSPGGPIRFTYLLEDNNLNANIGLIANNGEKIQESLPNIAMAYFSKGELEAYKLFCNANFNNFRSGRLLTPNLQNSLFSNGRIINTGIKSEFLGWYDYPSQFRDTTIVVPKANESAKTLLEGMVKKEYAVRIV